MSCKICGRNACHSSFHSIKEQEEFEKYSNELSNYKESDLINLIKENELYEKDNEVLKEMVDELSYLVESFTSQILKPSSSFDFADFTSTFENIKELKDKL